MQYTQFDLDTIKSFKIRYKSQQAGKYRDIAGDIRFQFPPKITNDNKRGNWTDALNQFDEPGAIYTQTGPREISMSFSYIVTDASDSSDKSYKHLLESGGDPDYWNNKADRWTAERIHQQLRKLRGYFNVSRSGAGAVAAQQGFTDSLVLEIQLAGIGGLQPMTGRMTNVDIKYSDTLISYYSDGSRPVDVTQLNTFPLKTDVSIGLRLWAQVGHETSPDKVIQNVPGLVIRVPVDWY